MNNHNSPREYKIIKKDKFKSNPLLSKQFSTNLSSSNHSLSKCFKYSNQLPKKHTLSYMKHFQKITGNLSKYNVTSSFLHIKAINNIMYDEQKHLVTLFKDYLLWDENSDFLKRFYYRTESKNRIKKLSKYYETNTFIPPSYFKLECVMIMIKHLKKKKKYITILQLNKCNKQQINSQNFCSIFQKEDIKAMETKISKESIVESIDLSKIMSRLENNTSVCFKKSIDSEIDISLLSICPNEKFEKKENIKVGKLNFNTIKVIEAFTLKSPDKNINNRNEHKTLQKRNSEKNYNYVYDKPKELVKQPLSSRNEVSDFSNKKQYKYLLHQNDKENQTDKNHIPNNTSQSKQKARTHSKPRSLKKKFISKIFKNHKPDNHPLANLISFYTKNHGLSDPPNRIITNSALPSSQSQSIHNSNANAYTHHKNTQSSNILTPFNQSINKKHLTPATSRNKEKISYEFNNMQLSRHKASQDKKKERPSITNLNLKIDQNFSIKTLKKTLAPSSITLGLKPELKTSRNEFKKSGRLCNSNSTKSYVVKSIFTKNKERPQIHLPKETPLNIKKQILMDITQIKNQPITSRNERQMKPSVLLSPRNSKK